MTGSRGQMKSSSQPIWLLPNSKFTLLLTLQSHELSSVSYQLEVSQADLTISAQWTLKSFVWGGIISFKSREKWYFFGQADRKGWPPTHSPYSSWFFCARLTWEYDYMCSETDFTQEKSHFHPTARIPNSSLLLAAALSKIVSGIAEAWKLHFRDPSQWEKMCFEYQRIKFQC